MLEGFLVGLLTTLSQAAPFLILGYMVAAVIREFVPIETLTSHFGATAAGVLRAVTVGSLLPICSCGVVPLGVGLVRSGAAVGTTLAFMHSAPAISPVAVLLAWNILGPTLTGAYIVAVLLGALGLGLIANKTLGPAPERAAPEAPRGPDDRPVTARLRSAARWAFWDLGADVSVDLLVGLSVAALLVAAIPPDWVRSSLGQPGLASLFLAVLLAVPAYTCTVPSIPIVRSLLLLGISPGAAIVLLIAGPATNLGEINVIRGQVGWRAAGIYVGAVIATAVGGGLLVDQVLFPAYRYEAVEVAGQLMVTSCCVPLSFAAGERPTLAVGLSSVSLWQVPFVVLLTVTLLVGLVRRALRRIRPLAPLAAQPQEQLT